MQSRTSFIKKSFTISTVIVLFIFICGGSINPLIWKTQFERRVSPQMLIQPEKVAHFYQEIGGDTTDPYKLFKVIESEILYTNDFFNHASLDHLSTAEEVVQSRQDDCDGQAVLLCSVLRYAGYDAYTVIGPSHAWVEVYAEETLFINYRGGTWFVKFNESSVEWRITSLVLLILEEFLFLILFFSLLFYAHEKGAFTHIQEVFSYLKYVLLFFSGYLLIGAVFLFAESILLVFWALVALIALLLSVKLFEKLRST